MGQPGDNDDQATQHELLVSAVLSPLQADRKLNLYMLMRVGVDEDILFGFYQALRKEIADLTGWKPLTDAVPYYRWPRITWSKEVVAHHLEGKMAVIVLDQGNKTPDELKQLDRVEKGSSVTIFLLRDGQFVYARRGFNEEADCIETGDLNFVYKTMLLDQTRFTAAGRVFSEQPFLVLIKGFAKLLDTSVTTRKEQVAKQEVLLGQFNTIINSLSYR